MAPRRWLWGPPSPPGLSLLLAEPRGGEGGDGGMSFCLPLAPPSPGTCFQPCLLCLGGNRAGRGNVPCVGRGTGLQRAWPPGQRGPQMMPRDPGGASSPGGPQFPRVSPTPPGVPSSSRCPQLPGDPISPGCCSFGAGAGLGKPAEGNRSLPGGRGADKAALCASMPRVVPGGEVAGPGRPQGWGHCWGGAPHRGRLLGHRCGQHPRAGPQGIVKGVSGTEGGGRGGAVPGGTGRAVVPSGYPQEENASKNHLLTLKLTSLLGIALPAGRHQREKQCWRGGGNKPLLLLSAGIGAPLFCELPGGKQQLHAAGEGASNEGGCDSCTKCLQTPGNWQLLVSELSPVCPHPGAAQLLARQTPTAGFISSTPLFST